MGNYNGISNQDNDVPRVLKREHLQTVTSKMNSNNEMKNELDETKRRLPCYYDRICYKLYELSDTKSVYIANGCGTCTISHPDDKSKFYERWSLARQDLSKSDCINRYINVEVPVEWIDDKGKWIRAQDQWKNYYDGERGFEPD